MALYKRRIYLINRPFQLKFSFYLAIIVLISSAIYPVLIYDLYSNVSQSISVDFPDAANNFNNKKNILLITLFALQACLSVLFFIVGIFISHKVAGPLYKLQLFLKALSNGEEHGKLYFRNGDYFPDIAESYNEAIDKLTLRKLTTKQELEELRDHLSNNNQIDKEKVLIMLKETIERI